MGNYPCGVSDSKINYVDITKKKILREHLKLNFNPEIKKESVVYMSNISENAFTSFKHDQILESFEIELVKPENLTLDLKLVKRSANLVDSTNEIVNNLGFDEFKSIKLKKDEKYVHKFSKFDEKKSIIWGGFDNILKRKLEKYNLKVLKELYYQYHGKAFDVNKEPKCKPYKLENDKMDEVYIHNSYVDKFKTYISDNTLKDLTYHTLQETKVDIKGDVDDYIIEFTFKFVNFTKKKLDKKYEKYEMII